MNAVMAPLSAGGSTLPAARRPGPPPGFHIPGVAVFGRWRMTPIEAIDTELAKLSEALLTAILAENHARYAALMADADDLLDRRLAFNVTSWGGSHGPTR
jgi:hypothetical protein